MEGREGGRESGNQSIDSAHHRQPLLFVGVLFVVGLPVFRLLPASSGFRLRASGFRLPASFRVCLSGVCLFGVWSLFAMTTVRCLFVVVVVVVVVRCSFVHSFIPSVVRSFTHSIPSFLHSLVGYHLRYPYKKASPGPLFGSAWWRGENNGAFSCQWCCRCTEHGESYESSFES